MEETRTGGTKEFVISVIWTVILMFIGWIITSMLPSYKIIGMFITILMFCVLGFFVLTRYSAVYTYTLKHEKLRVNRKIGHRNKEVEIAMSLVRSIGRSSGGAKVKRTRHMRSSIFSRGRVYYLIYETPQGDEMLVFEPSEDMARLIKRKINKSTG